MGIAFVDGLVASLRIDGIVAELEELGDRELVVTRIVAGSPVELGDGGGAGSSPRLRVGGGTPRDTAGRAWAHSTSFLPRLTA